VGRFVVRRLLQMALVLLGASAILFVALFVLPGDPVGSLAGSDRARDPVVVKELRHRYHLDQSLPAQYVHYVGRLVHGDLGLSYRLQRPVNQILGEKLANTVRLAVAAILIEVLIGITAGVISAVSRYSFSDVFVTLSTTIAVGFPTFVIGLIFQQAFALKLHWLPLSGHRQGLFRSIWLPALTLASVDAAIMARLMRGTLLEVMRADYIRTAMAKGLSRRVVILKHALRNSVIPVVTYIGIGFGTLLGGAIVTEVIFNWDGVGQALVTAIGARDNPIVLGAVTYAVAAFVLINLVVDISYAYLDPRIRLS
jgi:ABC-type dipeptide/oligopeptide/nickel transport system permease component